MLNGLRLLPKIWPKRIMRGPHRLFKQMIFRARGKSSLPRKSSKMHSLQRNSAAKAKLLHQASLLSFLIKRRLTASSIVEFFRFEQYNPTKHDGIRIFKSRIVNEIKGKGINKPYEKSRFVIQSYNNDGKLLMLTQSPIIQRSS
jgi:hypothetical protein